MVRNFCIAIVAVAAALLFVACDATVHEYPSQLNDEIEVRIVLNTDGVSNVSCDIYNDALPRPTMSSEMLRVLFYSPESGREMAQCFISEKSVTPEGREILCGRANIPPGDYIMLAYNFDIATVAVEGENSIAEINAFTPEIPEYLYAMLRGSSEASEVPVFRQPDHLLVCRKRVHVAASDRLQIIEGEARTVVDTYYVQVRVRGLKYASSAKATLSGMSPSTRFGIGEYPSDDAKIMFDISGGTDPRIEEENKDVLCSLFNTFGKTEGQTSELTVRFDVITHDGTRFVKTLDIEPVFNTDAARERHWLLIDYMLDIPEPHKPGGGFDPVMTDWDEIHDEIELNL